MKRVQVLVRGNKILKMGGGIVELPGTRLYGDMEWPCVEEVPLPIADVFWDGEKVIPNSKEAQDEAVREANQRLIEAEVARDIVRMILASTSFEELKENIERKLNPAKRATATEVLQVPGMRGRIFKSLMILRFAQDDIVLYPLMFF